jgi:hypothetical protein
LRLSELVSFLRKKRLGGDLEENQNGNLKWGT